MNKSASNIIIDDYFIMMDGNTTLVRKDKKKKFKSVIDAAYKINKESIFFSVVIANKTFENLDFDNINMTNILFIGCKFINCTFRNMRIEKCDFMGSSFDSCVFNNITFNISHIGSYWDEYSKEFNKICKKFSVKNLRINFNKCAFNNDEFLSVKFYNTSFDASHFYNCSFDRYCNDGVHFGDEPKNANTTENATVEFKDCNIITTFFGIHTTFNDIKFKNSMVSHCIFYKNEFISFDIDNESKFIRNSMEKCQVKSGSNLTVEKLAVTDSICNSCPSEGSFIAWKKVTVYDNHDTDASPSVNAILNFSNRHEYLIKLKIPADAKRVSSTSNKCRCDKAKCLKIYEIKDNFKVVPSKLTKITNVKVIDDDTVKCGYYKLETDYVVGEYVYPDAFDENPLNECSSGIHFFVNKHAAINY